MPRTNRDGALISRPTDVERAQGATLRALAAQWYALADGAPSGPHLDEPWTRAAANVMITAKRIDGDEDDKVRLPITDAEATTLSSYMTRLGGSLAEPWQRGLTYVDRGTDPATGEPYIDLVSRRNRYALDVVEAVEWSQGVVAEPARVVLAEIARRIHEAHAAAKAAQG